MEIKSIYGERAEEFERQFQLSEGVFKRWSYSRLIITLVAIALFVVFANERNASAMGLVLIIFPLAFGITVKKHNSIKAIRERFKNLASLNKEELQRQELVLDKIDDGAEFIDSSHPNSSDLDLFGRHSLFQLINRTSTYLGRNLIAKWLKSEATTDEIIMRQGAAKELSNDIDWIQDFQARGIKGGVKKEDTSMLLDWLKEDEKSFFRTPMIWPLFALVFTITMFLLVSFNVLSFGFLLFPLATNAFLLSRIFTRLKNLMEITYEGNKALKSISSLIEKVEESNFDNNNLKEIQSSFMVDSQSASQTLNKLNGILDYLNNRKNPLFALFNIVLLLDFFLYNSLIKWKEKHASNTSEWFDKLAYLECLTSLAGFRFSYPEYCSPVLSDTPFHFEVKGLGHPLIDSAKRVTNDTSLIGKGNITIITGSNMSGKSTFLRTVGINLVLAQMGALVCATSFSFSPLRLFTSMRNSDLLEESISSFYSELKRLRELLNSIQPGKAPVMFMIDEVLKGTNSKDRHIGSVSLVHQLSELDCFGWVSTHDLSLGNLGMEIPKVKLVSFNSQIVDDDLVFDYRLTEGLCYSFNASILMKKMGIKILDE